MHEHTASVSRLIHAQPREIWSALTTPSRIKLFLYGADAVTTWAVGSPITFSGVMGGRAYEDVGEILAFEPNEHLAYSHWSSLSGTPHTPENEHVVSFDLQPEVDGTTVTITQAARAEGAPPADAATREHAAKTWTAVLEGLARNAETAANPPVGAELGGQG